MVYAATQMYLFWPRFQLRILLLLLLVLLCMSAGVCIALSRCLHPVKQHHWGVQTAWRTGQKFSTLKPFFFRSKTHRVPIANLHLGIGSLRVRQYTGTVFNYHCFEQVKLDSAASPVLYVFVLYLWLTHILQYVIQPTLLELVLSAFCTRNYCFFSLVQCLWTLTSSFV